MPSISSSDSGKLLLWNSWRNETVNKRKFVDEESQHPLTVGGKLQLIFFRIKLHSLYSPSELIFTFIA